MLDSLALYRRVQNAATSCSLDLRMAHLLTHARLTRNSLPLFLCPIVATLDAQALAGHRRGRFSGSRTLKKNLHTQSAKDVSSPPLQFLDLPQSCPGCGAYTQNIKKDEPGFYSTNRKTVKLFLNQGGPVAEASGHAETFDEVIRHADQSVLAKLGLHEPENTFKPLGDGRRSTGNAQSDGVPTPVCDRCHHLIHHHTGVSVTHPTLQSIREIISESPHKHNHVYHVLDAADFPLSLIPSLQKTLSLSPPRSMNRRAKTTFFQHGRTAEMSYIITRADLLAPKKEQLDGLMPYIIDVLRDALGGSARDVRLGNVRCVSSKRAWWTNTVKEDIYDRGGGGWMVGKVNVGKSNLFQHVYPKGRTTDVNFDSIRERTRTSGQPNAVFDTALPNRELDSIKQTPDDASGNLQDSEIADESPLPPVPKETPFPVLPLVSPLPGTTASPIRLSFGNGKGELVDLPGLDRGDLESFVIEHHKKDLVMRERIKPTQLTVKPGQSLLVGGLVQIKPVTPDVTLLAYPFVPLPCHVSSTEKIQSIIKGEVESGMPTIARQGAGSRMQSAGTFPIKWDITKQRAGPLTAKAAAGLSIRTLPFVVLSTDILIEGCGWVELVAQVRKKDFENSETIQTKTFFDDKSYPMVEVVSPNGRHVGYRRPMGAWLLGGEKPSAAGGRTSRPRRSMKGVKKNMKKAARAHNL